LAVGWLLASKATVRDALSCLLVQGITVGLYLTS